MKWVKRILLGLIGIIAVLVVISFFLPATAEVERSVVIDAAPEKIFPHVNDLRATQEWSPWAKRDPEMTQTFSGPDQGVGQSVAWQSDHPEVGSGTQTITESVENRRVAVDLDFGDMGTADAAFDLEPQGAGTEVTWSFQTELGMNPFMRYLGLMFDGMIGPDYERGLTSLKTLVEAQPDTEN